MTRAFTGNPHFLSVGALELGTWKMKIVDNISEGRHISEACQYCTSIKRQEYFDVQSVFRFADK